MKSVFRPTRIEDLEAVRQFLQRVFDVRPEAPFLDPAVMRWKYWDSRDDWTEPRAWVLERDGAITAHAGLWPMVAGDVRGVQMIDWASAQEAPGAGLLLVQKLAGMFDFMYSIGGSEMTRKMLPGFGFVEYAQQWKGARPLRPMRQILTHQTRNRNLAPRLARNILWSMNPPLSPTSAAGWSFTETAPRESPCSGYFAPRSAGFFRYLLRCPAAHIHFYSLENRQGAQGHFVLSVLRGQARLAGMWLHEPDPEARRAAFSQAQMAAKRLDGAYEFAAMGSGEKSREAAAAAGLRISEGLTPVYLLNKKGKLNLDPDFQFQPADDDAFFLDSGSVEYWT